MTTAHRTSLVVASLLVLTGSGCRGEAKPADKAAATVNRVPVETTLVRRSTFEQRLRAPGSFQPIRVARIAVEMPGRLLELPFREGDRVEMDALLARLDSRIARAQLGQANAALAQVRVQQDLARTTLARVKKLAASKLVDQAQQDQAAAAERQARSAAQMAEASRDLAAASLAKLKILSPIAGQVLSRHVEVGEVVSPGAPLLVLADLSSMKLVVDVPERAVDAIRVGQTATVRINALTNAVRKGTVTHVPATANTDTRTYPVEITVDNSDGRIRGGMMARAELVLESLADQVVVPLDALVDEPPVRGAAGITVVYLVDGGAARRVPVVSGEMEGEEVRIEAGLSGGEKLIIVGQRRVVDGDAVEIISRAPAAEAAAQREDATAVERPAAPAAPADPAAPAETADPAETAETAETADAAEGGATP